MYPLTLLHVRLNMLPEEALVLAARAESSWTELAQRKPESWEWKELAAFVDMTSVDGKSGVVGEMRGGVGDVEEREELNVEGGNEMRIED
jgi:hypothetical protein